MFSSLRRTFAITFRILRQISNDRRTLLLMLAVPSLLTGLFSWMLQSSTQFDVIGPRLVGLFPFTVMFLLASITTLKERQSGTLERFFTMPMRRGEFIIGYAVAFGIMASVQASITLWFAVNVCGLTAHDNFGDLILAAICNAVLGMSLGLLASAFARSEFQVIQFMPAFIFPQIILGGLFIPIDKMPDVLHAISDWLPLTHALRSLSDIANQASQTDIMNEIYVVIAVSVGSLLLGALTLRRKTA
jgi:ABC transporter DrrB family efflux protein